MGKYYSGIIPDEELYGVYYDTRSMKPDGVFCCLLGNSDDGHKYVRRAVELGAKVIIASRHVICDAPVILVDDTRSALSYLTARFYGAPKLTLYGITGTNGKTTVSYFLASILKAAGKSCGVIGTNGVYLDGERLALSFNTPTTPNMPELYAALKLLEERGADCAVMEVTSHALEQGRVDGLEFDAGVFTNLTQDHLDYHKNMQAYFAAKCKLFEHCRIGVVNADDEYGKRLLNRHNDYISYGMNNADVRADEASLDGSGSDFLLSMGDEQCRVRINIPGSFSIYNALAAAAAAYAANVGIDAVREGLAAVSGVSGRMERVGGLPFDVIIDYAHTPDGLEKALSALSAAKQGRLICVFGCGGDRDRTKRAPMGRIATELADIAVITDDNPRCEQSSEIIADILRGIRKGNYIVIENRRRAIHAALSIAQQGDCVLLAGKGQETYQIIGKMKYHFDEREIVAEYIKLRSEE